MNDKKNYAISRIREATMNWAFDHQGQIPTLDDVYQCAMRNIDHTKPEEMELFKWYGTDLLKAVLGRSWDESVFNFAHISTATNKYDPGKKLVRSSTEAFICLVYENNEEKYPAVYNYLKEFGRNAKIPPRNKENKGELLYKTKWTDQDQGQKAFSGWSPESLVQFKKYSTTIKEAHKKNKKQLLKVEETLFNNLRIMYKIDCATVEEQRKQKRRRKRKRDEPEERVYLQLDDDETEEDSQEKDSQETTSEQEK